MVRKYIGLVVIGIGSSSAYVIAKYLEIVHHWTVLDTALAGAFAAVGILLLLNYLLLDAPMLVPWGRRLLRVPGFRLEGLWLESLVREQVQHYTILRLQFSASYQGYSMTGNSYRSDGAEHSDWRTLIMKINPVEGGDIEAEYTYVATPAGSQNKPAHGSGLTRFRRDPISRLTMGGRGYYMSTEDHNDHPVIVNYAIYRLDDAFLEHVEWKGGALENMRNRPAFVQHVHQHFLMHPH